LRGKKEVFAWVDCFGGEGVRLGGGGGRGIQGEGRVLREGSEGGGRAAHLEFPGGVSIMDQRG